MKKAQVTSISRCFIAAFLYVQALPADAAVPAPPFRWATRLIGMGSYGLAVDPGQNSYVAGVGNSGSFMVSKLAPDGHTIWSRNTTGSGRAVARGIGLDAAANCYVAGYRHGSVSFASTTLSGCNYEEVFIAKYSNNGAVLWARQSCGSYYNGAMAIAVDPQGNSHVAGFFGYTVNLGGITLSTAERQELFIARYDTNGTLLWARQTAGGAKYGAGVAVDSSGNCFVAGEAMAAGTTFDTMTLADSGAFLAKYDPGGSVLWVRHLDNVQMGVGDFLPVAVDPGGNCFVAGASSIAKLSPAGNLLAVGKSSPDYSHTASSLAVDSAGRCYITGEPFYCTKLDPSCAELWTKYATSVLHNDNYKNSGVAVDSQGVCYLSGSFYGTGQFDALTLNGTSDILSPDVYVVALDRHAPFPVNLSLDRQAAIVRLSWDSEPGCSYQVQYRTNLSLGTWANDGTAVTATNTEASALRSASGEKRFYRLSVVQ